MTDDTITRAYLGNSVYREIGLSLTESMQLVDAVFEEVSLALEEGNSVKLSSFGTFSLRKKNARVGRNPKTGVEVPIDPRTVLSFNPSNLLKQQVNENLGGHTPQQKATKVANG
jgi:integration host factor subunit alpha